jgi:DnaJ-class molecular chaperone
MSTSDESHYEVLGVGPAASVAELKKAFQAQARLYHPDTMHGKAPAAVSAAEARFHRVHEAWTVLQDPSLRAQYDRDNEGASTHFSSSSRITPLAIRVLTTTHLFLLLNVTV